jgi:hypothetical protein
MCYDLNSVNWNSDRYWGRFRNGMIIVFCFSGPTPTPTPTPTVTPTPTPTPTPCALKVVVI